METQSIMFNTNKCMARISGNLSCQCKNKKKSGKDYCGIHIKMKNIIRIDEQYIKSKPEIRKSIVNIFSNDLPPIKKLKVSDIKQALRYYNLTIKKKKIDNYNTYLNFLRTLDEYKMYTKSIFNLQRIFRGYRQRLLNSYKGPGLFNRKIVNNEMDFFTFENINEIQYEDYFSFKDKDGFVYAFNIKSINELLKNDNKNPYTRNSFDSFVQYNLEKLINNTSKNIEIKSEISDNPYIKMKRKCVRIFQRMDELELYTQAKWFLDLNLLNLKYLYAEIEDIWNYRAMLSFNMKKNYINISNGKVFSKSVSEINKISNKLILQNLILDQFERFAFEGSNKENSITSCYWILTGLTMVSQGAAEGYPHLVQSSSLI